MNTNILKAGFIFLITCISFAVFAQKSEESITIKSVIGGQDCVDIIQKDLPHRTKGIKSVKANATSNEIVVVYRADKTTPNDIRKAITAIGYDADDLKASEAAFKKLPEQCRKAIAAKKDTCKKPASGCSHHGKPGGCGKRH